MGIEQRSPSAAQALLVSEDLWHDVYRGTAEELVAAGLARLDMFPGQPERGKAQCSYEPNGDRSPTGGNWNKRTVIRRRGKGLFEVRLPIDKAEHERRQKEQEEKDAARWRARDEEAGRLQFHFGFAFGHAYEASPAHFNVGDEAIVWDDEQIVEVIAPYGTHNVEGHGERVGYGVRYGNGHERFVPPYLLLETKTNRVRHLRLVETRPRA